MKNVYISEIFDELYNYNNNILFNNIPLRLNESIELSNTM